jgi:hypothetical protein
MTGTCLREILKVQRPQKRLELDQIFKIFVPDCGSDTILFGGNSASILLLCLCFAGSVLIIPFNFIVVGKLQYTQPQFLHIFTQCSLKGILTI